MFSRVWEFIRDEANRATLAWLGAGVLTIAGVFGWSLIPTDCGHLTPDSDVAGTWWSAGNNATMTVKRTGCTISSNFGVGTAPHNEISGEYKGDKINYTDTRTFDGCTVVFYGTFSELRLQQMTSHIYRTSGACHFDEGWQETLTWVRRN